MRTVITKNGKSYLASVDENLKEFSDLVEIPYVLVKASELMFLTRNEFTLWARSCVGSPITYKGSPTVTINGLLRFKEEDQDVENEVLVDPVKFTVKFRGETFNLTSADQALKMGYRIAEMVEIFGLKIPNKEDKSNV